MFVMIGRIEENLCQLINFSIFRVCFSTIYCLISCFLFICVFVVFYLFYLCYYILLKTDHRVINLVESIHSPFLQERSPSLLPTVSYVYFLENLLNLKDQAAEQVNHILPRRNAVRFQFP